MLMLKSESHAEQAHSSLALGWLTLSLSSCWTLQQESWSCPPWETSPLPARGRDGATLTTGVREQTPQLPPRSISWDLGWPTITSTPINDMLEFLKGLVLRNDNHRIPMT